jgi:tRNA-Thr(GGU) m(6)t(6)A37 methyltransferase TsaA
MIVLRAIGRVESSLKDKASAPRQGDEGGPDAWLVFDPDVRDGLRGLEVGAEVLLLTWFDRADRGTLVVHPRGDLQRPQQGVFATRSPDRPNPLGLHRVTILSIEDDRVLVNNLEALDGTPIIDVKPVIGPPSER